MSLTNGFQRLIDDATGRLNERGITPAAILREKTTASAVSTIAIYLSLMAIVPLWLASILLAAILAIAAMFYLSWREYASDARKDWSESLAKKYSDRALKKRETEWLARWLSMYTTIAMLAFVAFSLANGMNETGLIVVMAQRFVVDLFSNYIESSIPSPPKQRDRAPAPSPA